MSSGSSVPLPGQPDPKQESYYQWSKRKSGEHYENWMPWVEDLYLKWWAKDNKASYATKDTLAKTKIPGSEDTPIGKLQDDTHNLVAGQVGKGGVLEPVGNLTGKEGINRMERGGKDDKGDWIPGGHGKQITDPVAGGVKSGISGVQGMFGGKK